MLRPNRNDTAGIRGIVNKLLRTICGLSKTELCTRLAFLSCLCLLSIPGWAASLDGATRSFRLSPGPRLVGTRAPSSGGGSVEATLEGSKLILRGSYCGLLAVPTGAYLRMGSLPGVRGPLVAHLTIASATTGTFRGEVQLNSEQLDALHKGGLYVEIDSDKAPDGDLWGWLFPFEPPAPLHSRQ